MNLRGSTCRFELTKRKKITIQQPHPSQAMHGEHASSTKTNNLLTKRCDFELHVLQYGSSPFREVQPGLAG